MQRSVIAFILGALVLALIAFFVFGTKGPATSIGAVSTTTPGISIPKDFTLKEKIGQLLFVGVTQKSVAIDLEHTYQIGGFLLKTNANLFSKAATDDVAAAGKIAPLFAVDQEGGEVSRLSNKTFKKYTARYMDMLPDTQVQEIAKEMGLALSDIGANVDFAPVADLDDGENAAISKTERSFSINPDVVAEKASAFAAGLRDAGILPTFKHFPGLGHATGNTDGDTDTGSATTPPLSVLETSDLKPYASLLSSQGLSAVMVGNQTVPDLTDGLPASLSPAAYKLLRTRYGFTQVVFTDELLEAVAVKSVTKSPEDAVISALQAGADMSVINISSEQEVGDIIDAVAAAVVDGRIKESRIDESLQRVLALKAALRK